MSSSALLQDALFDAPQTTSSTCLAAVATSEPISSVPEIVSSQPGSVTVRCTSCSTILKRPRSYLRVRAAGAPLFCTKPCELRAYKVDLTCARCGSGFQRRRGDVEKAKRHGFVRTFCSKACQGAEESDRFAEGRACVTCGKPRPSKEVHSSPYCSPACHRRVLRPMEGVNCEHCGKAFELLRYELAKKRRKGGRVYCSRQCVSDGHASRGTTCKHCGTGMPRAKGRQFCSTECRRKGGKYRQPGFGLGGRVLPEITCPICARVFQPKSSRTKYCDRACAESAHSLRMTGVGNSRYKDGTSYADWFRKMRPVIFERDGNVCVACKECPPPLVFFRSGVQRERTQMTVHHISHDPRDNRPENLILLCQGCHMRHHKSATTPFPWFAEYATGASRSMTSRLKATATSLQERYSSTTA